MVMPLRLNLSFGARPRDEGVVGANRTTHRIWWSLHFAPMLRGNDTARRLLTFSSFAGSLTEGTTTFVGPQTHGVRLGERSSVNGSMQTGTLV
jgi:hypothetical protein